jgi:hypothetical protein
MSKEVTHITYALSADEKETLKRLSKRMSNLGGGKITTTEAILMLADEAMSNESLMDKFADRAARLVESKKIQRKLRSKAAKGAA